MEISDTLFIIILFVYLFLYYFIFKSPSVRNILRKAEGCFQKTCLHYPLVEIIKCEIDPDHFDKYRNSTYACDLSQARISDEELKILEFVHKKRNDAWRHIIAVASILATFAVSKLK